MKALGLGFLFIFSFSIFATPCTELAQIIEGHSLSFTNYSADGSIREQGNVEFLKSDDDLNYKTKLQFTGIDDIHFKSSLHENNPKPASCLMAWWLQPGYFYDAAILEDGAIRLTRDEYDSYIILKEDIK